ncbi:unnamed protein product [Closterium sp. Yama58-4]|nr:unnamed protein product [Closterium sp. Yama58-4]
MTGARSGKRGTKRQGERATGVKRAAAEGRSSAAAVSPTTTANPAPVAAHPAPAAAEPAPLAAEPAPPEEEEEGELFGDVIAQPLQGNGQRGLTLYARTMKQAGVNPSPEADKFHPESRPNPVNPSLRAQAAIAREAVETLQTDCKTKDLQILKALGIAGSLADAVLLQKIVNLDFERMMSETVNDFLFDGDHVNMSPRRSDFVQRLVAHAGFTAGSDEATRLVAHMKDKDIIKKTEKRFNNRIGKIYGACRRSLRLIQGVRLFVIKRAPNGTIRAVEPDDFATRCHSYVAVPAFMACARQFVTQDDPDRPLGIYASQLLLILAVVRFKLRHPTCNKLQLGRSGDTLAISRQARIVQRYINSMGRTEGEFIGIGRICIAQWVTIPQEVLDADVLGDEDAEDEFDDDEVVDEDADGES